MKEKRPIHKGGGERIGAEELISVSTTKGDDHFVKLQMAREGST